MESFCLEHFVEGEETHTVKVLDNDQMSPLFAATVEATAEALWNSLFAAETTKGVGGKVVEALPVEKVVKMIKKEKGIK